MTSEVEIDLFSDLMDDALTEPLQKHIENEKIEKQLKSENDGKLAKQFEELNKKYNSEKESNMRLTLNMQMLLAVARADIERKDKLIAEHREEIAAKRRELDNLKFRRTKVTVSTTDNSSQTDEPSRSRQSSTSDRDKNRSHGSRRHEKSSSQEKVSSKSHSDRRSSREDRPTQSHYRSSDRRQERSKEWRKRSRSPRKENDERSKRRKSNEPATSKSRSDKGEDLRKTLLRKQGSAKSSSVAASRDKPENAKVKRESPRKKNPAESTVKLNVPEIETLTRPAQAKEMTNIQQEVETKPDDKDETLMSTPSDPDILQSQKKKIEEELAAIDANLSLENKEEISVAVGETETLPIAPTGVASPVKAAEIPSNPSPVDTPTVDNTLTESTELNSSLNSSKENSLNLSQASSKKKCKTTYEKEIANDGRVIFTVIRHKKKKKSS